MTDKLHIFNQKKDPFPEIKTLDACKQYFLKAMKENDLLKTELKATNMIFWAMITASDGKIIIPDAIMAMAHSEIHKNIIQSSYEAKGKKTIMTTITAPDKEDLN